MSAPRVFLSYAGEDHWWVKLFRPYFELGNVVIEDYKAENVPFGDLKTALDARIEGSVAIVAFVSEKYKKKQWTVAEWEKSLEEKDRRRLIFVPVMLDADAIEWWQTLRRGGKLTALSRDYQYADFTDGGGYALPSPDKPQYIQRIVKLAEGLKEEIFRAPDTGGGGSVLLPQQPVVFLGHPSAGLPTDLQVEVQQVTDALGSSVVKWNDRWRRKGGTGPAVDANPVFVQPITDAEAADYVEEPGRISEYLTALGRPNSRVAIWLPKNYSDAEFAKAAEAGADGFKSPVFRTDSPQDLTKWLLGETKHADVPEAMIVQVEGSGTPDGTPSEFTKEIVDRLKTEVWNIVSRVTTPPPVSPAWQFWDTQFARQIRVLPGSRAIVAIHDLDIKPSADPRVVRKDVEKKFARIYAAVDAEQKQRQDAGKPPLKLFWTALLLNNAGALPFSNYPDDGRFKDWRLLEFSQTNEDGPDGPAQFEPDPASLAVFRTNLYAWASTP